GAFISKLDAMNPMVAARLTKTLISYNHYEAPYADLMRSEILKLRKTPSLSPDLTEIITQALGA
ncbi:MAG: aminopeptidase N C-terminal domain-containing protein, partial [Gammaproteobacteria bacterium]|nr:aminopeptidase N C-terminal domain-containing protein [Gammaproteobacteria bacterium]